MKRSYRNLFVWQASVDLAVRVMSFADRLIEQRRFALADQMVRAALSIPGNIAEGQGRLTTRDRRHFLSQARGSLYELETHLEIATRARLLDQPAPLHELTAKIGSGLSRMIDTLSDQPRTPGVRDSEPQRL